jgi:hypothetical protein
MTSDKCVLNDKLMLVGFILIFYVKKNTAQLRNKQTLTDYFNGLFLHTGCHFS